MWLYFHTGGREAAEFTGNKYMFSLSFMLKGAETPDVVKLVQIHSYVEPLKEEAFFDKVYNN